MNSADLAALVETVVAAEDAERGNETNMSLGYRHYIHAPLIALSTPGVAHYHHYDLDGVRWAVTGAYGLSQTTSLMVLVARGAGGEQTRRYRTICGFHQGIYVPLDLARIVAANGYTETGNAALARAAELAAS